MDLLLNINIAISFVDQRLILASETNLWLAPSNTILELFLW